MWLRDRSSLLLLSSHLCIGSSSTTPLGILGIQDHPYDLVPATVTLQLVLLIWRCHSERRASLSPSSFPEPIKRFYLGKQIRQRTPVFSWRKLLHLQEYGEAWGTFSKNSCGFVLVKANWKDVGRCFGNIGQLDCRRKPRRQLSRAVLRSEHISNAGFRNCHFQRDWIWIDGSAQQFMPQGIVENNSEISQP